MSRHVSYRGATIDMESLRRENEKVPAIGNMPVNARGDQIKGGVITKTADQIARENHRVQSVVVNTGLKGKPQAAPEVSMEPLKQPPKPKTATKVEKAVTTEKELPNGDIVVGEPDAS